MAASSQSAGQITPVCGYVVIGDALGHQAQIAATMVLCEEHGASLMVLPEGHLHEEVDIVTLVTEDGATTDCNYHLVPNASVLQWHPTLPDGAIPVSFGDSPFTFYNTDQGSKGLSPSSRGTTEGSGVADSQIALFNDCPR